MGFLTNAVGDGLAAVVSHSGGPWYRQRHLMLLNFSLLSLILFSSANGYDGSMMNGLQALPQWQDFMHHPTGAWLGFINAAQSLGAVLNYPFVAYVANKWGRKMAIWIGYFYLLLGVALQTASNNSAAFVLGRVFLGGVSAWYAGGAPLLIAETAYPTHRAVATSLYNTGWYVGSLIAAWATFGTRNYTTSWAWRVPSLLQALVPLVSFAGLLMCPESPRWMVSVGRIENARAMLVKYHAGGDAQSALVDYEITEIQQTLQLEKQSKNNSSYVDMFKTKGNRHRLFISVTLGVFAQWNGVGVVSYYLAAVLNTVGITSVTQITLISGFLQLWNLFMAVGAACLVDKLGRRPLFLASCVGMLISYIVITGLSGSFANTGIAATGITVIPFLFLFYGSYDIAFTPLLISYPTEIWGYSMRARGLVATVFSTQLAVFFNIFVNPIALEAITWKYYLVYAVILVFITLTAYFCYPETRGHSLEEMAVVFDGAEAKAPTTQEVLEVINHHRNSVGGEKAGTFSHIESTDSRV